MLDIIKKTILKIKKIIIAYLYYSLENYREEIDQNQKKSFITLYSNAKLLKEAVIQNFSQDPNKIIIGSSSYIRGKLTVSAAGGKIMLGEWCYVGHRSEIFSLVSVIIGNRVLIAHDVNIVDNTAHSLDPIERHNHYRHTITFGRPKHLEDLPGVKSASIHIEDDVWISFGVTILKGVKIGARSVIAAGSIVTKDVPPDVLYRCKIDPIMTPLDNTNQTPNFE